LRTPRRIAHQQRDAHPLHDLVVVGGSDAEPDERGADHRRQAPVELGDRSRVSRNARCGKVQILGARFQIARAARDARSEQLA